MAAHDSLSEEALLAEFATAPDIVGRMNAARTLMAVRKLTTVAEDSRFWEGIEKVSAICRQSPDGKARLLAAELLVRLSKALRAHRDRILDHLRPALAEALPDLREMPAPLELGKEFKAAEARENVALGLSYVHYPWVPQYRLTALVQEERSQEVRVLLAGQLFGASNSLEEAVDGIRQAADRELARLGATAAARRARDLLLALVPAIRSSQQDGTVDACVGLGRLAAVLIKPTNTRGIPQAEACIAALAAVLDELLRPRIHLVVDPQSYQPLRLVTAWWGRDIPFSPAVNNALAPILKHIRGAILLLSRMSQRSQGLVDALTIVAEGRANAGALLQELERQHPELDEPVRRWLRAGGRDSDQPSISGLERLDSAVSRDLDTVLATLLRQVALVTGMSEQAQSAHISQLLSDARDAARLRSLSTYGKVGEIVDFSSNFHEKSDKSVPLESRVRIVVPAVVRQSGDRIVGVLLKALVVEA